MEQLIWVVFMYMTLPTCYGVLCDYELNFVAAKRTIWAVGILTTLAFAFGSGLNPIQFGLLAALPTAVALVVADMKKQELPHRGVIWIAVIGCMVLFAQLEIVGLTAFWAIGTAIVLFVAYLILALVARAGLGGGDVKLIGACGLFFAPSLIPALLLYPFVMGAFFGTGWLIYHRADSEKRRCFPFGPAILVAVYVIGFTLI